MGAETRSPPNCQSTLDNRLPPLRGAVAAALFACLLVLWPLAASANMLAENLREKMHTDYLTGDGEQTMVPRNFAICSRNLGNIILRTPTAT